MKRFVLLMASLAISAVLNGCGGKGESVDAPPDFTAIAGDSLVTIAWTAVPGVDYWLFYAPGSGVTTTNWLTIGGWSILNVTPPYTLTGLINGSPYSFTMNARKNGGAGGPGAPTQVVVPRFAGTSWTVGTPLGTARLNGISALVTTNVIVGAGGALFSGATGSVPVARTNPAAPVDLNAITAATSGFMAIGKNGTAIFSADATTWAARTTGTVADLNAVASSGVVQYVAFGAAGTTIVSNDGTAWTTATSATTKDLYAATYGNGRYVAVGAQGTIVTSTDGAAWTAVASNTTSDLRGVALGAFVTTTGTGAATMSTTTYLFVAVGANGTLVTSADGLAWTVRAPISTNTLNAVAFSGQFVVVGNAGSIHTSADGITWQVRPSGTQNDLTALTRTTAGYVAVGAAGTYLTSQ